MHICALCLLQLQIAEDFLKEAEYLTETRFVNEFIHVHVCYVHMYIRTQLFRQITENPLKRIQFYLQWKLNVGHGQCAHSYIFLSGYTCNSLKTYL